MSISENRPNSYTRNDLKLCGIGELFGSDTGKLPTGNMLMIDRIVEISDEGGLHGKGFIKAELDINPDLWFFGCHFENDPVMPGCLGLDALWQYVVFSFPGSAAKARAGHSVPAR